MRHQAEAIDPLEERVRDILVNAGLQEVITYGLTEPGREEPLGLSGEYVRLKNPISSERVVMRHGVLAGVGAWRLQRPARPGPAATQVAMSDAAIRPVPAPAPVALPAEGLAVPNVESAPADPGRPARV